MAPTGRGHGPLLRKGETGTRAHSGATGKETNMSTRPGIGLCYGSLRDVTAIAGYVLTASGKRLCLVAMVNHANAPAARPALDALLQWAVGDNAAL